MAATVLRIPVTPPFATARIDPTERTWTNTRWGDLKASTLTSIIARAERGEVGDWADLCEFAMSTDGELASVYRTAIDRIVQSDYVVRPPEDSWDQELAEFAATFVRQQLSRIQFFDNALSKILHALGPGFSATEMHWDRDERLRVNYVKRLEFVHPHRFRYDEQKQLRLYDGGRRSTVGSVAGEQLPPTKWIVHEHMEVASYPGASGIMKGCIWTWMFGRWVEKFRIAHQEKHGSPFIYAKVPGAQLEAVRDQILDDLQNLTSEQAAVFEEGVTIDQIEAIATSDDGYHQYLADKKATYAMAWHGASDIAVQGDAGSNAAVETRASVNADPRMVARGKALSECLRYSLFRALCEFNLHLFPGGVTSVDQVPLPVMRRKTADDEVGGDSTARAQERRDDRAANGEPAPAEAAPSNDNAETQPAPEPAGKLAEQALNGAQVSSLLEIVASVASGQLTESSAMALMAAAGLVTDPAKARAILSGAQPAAEPEAPGDDPKAQAPAAPGQPRTTSRTATTSRRVVTPRTSTRSPSPFAQTLRRG